MENKNKKIYFFLITILLFGFVLRLYKIDNPIADWHSWRQSDTASVTRMFVQNGIDLLHPRYQDLSSTASGFENPKGFRFVEFPIYNAIHAVLVKAVPSISLEKLGRLLSATISIGTAIFIFLLGRKFISPMGGLVATFFFVALPFNVYFSRVVLPEPLTVLFAIASLWFFTLWIFEEKAWFLYLAGCLFALALLVKPYIGFYALPMLYLAVTKYGWSDIIKQKNLWVFLSLSLSPLFLWRAWMWNDEFLRGIPFWKWAFNGDEIRFRPSFWWWIFEERLGKLILGVWLVFPFVAGLVKRPKGNFPWFLHTLVFSQVMYVSIVATASVRHDYYQVLMIPAVVLVLGAGALALWNSDVFDRNLVRLGLVGTVVLGLFASFYSIKGFYNINHPEIIRAGVAADQLLPKDAKVIAPYDGDTAFLYQTKRVGWPYVTLPIDQMMSRLGAEYYVSVNFDEQTKKIMEQYKVLEKTQDYVIVDLRNK